MTHLVMPKASMISNNTEIMFGNQSILGSKILGFSGEIQYIICIFLFLVKTPPFLNQSVVIHVKVMNIWFPRIYYVVGNAEVVVIMRFLIQMGLHVVVVKSTCGQMRQAAFVRLSLLHMSGGEIT